MSKLKATLSAQLRRVRGGEVIVVTDRGLPVAKMVPADKRAPDLEALVELEQAGLVRIGSGKLGQDFWKARRAADPDASVRRAVLEEREAGH